MIMVPNTALEQQKADSIIAITRTLRFLHAPAECFEVRALGIPSRSGRPHVASGYFDDPCKAAIAVANLDLREPAGVYCTLNPINRALLARSSNRVKDYPEKTTSDSEIIHRNWLPLDIDPMRPSGISATESERAAARSVAQFCEEFLTGKGWPLPAIGSTGNGNLLLYRINLPNNEAANVLLQRVLQGLAAKADEVCGNVAHVDTVVSNAARMVRVLGTMNRKGDSTADRPHCRSELFELPEPLQEVTLEQLQDIANLAPPSASAAIANGKTSHPNPPTTAGRSDRPRLDMARWLTDRGIEFTTNRTSDGRSLFRLTRCVFDESHNGKTDAAFMQDTDGKAFYKCFHNGCAGLGWQQAKLAVGAPLADHYDPPLGRRIKPSTNEKLLPGTMVKALDRDNYGTVVSDEGSSVVVHFTSPDGQAAHVSLAKRQLALVDGAPLAGTANIFQPKLITSTEFDDGTYDQRFLVTRVLVAGQHCVLGGKSKTMKTTLACDLGISLGSGTPFLNHFPTVRARTAIFSGESGAFTLRETARRICDARGIKLRDVDMRWGFELPQIARAADLDVLAEVIELHNLEVVLIDPAYLCLLGGDTQGKQASNIFDMGTLLLGLSDVAKWTDATIVLLHHCRKNSAEIFTPPELEELSMAGFSEWARQWLLLGRREAYEQDSGLHKLWLNVGGSAGHSGCFAIDINEGILADDFSGRKWDVEVKCTGDAKKEASYQRDRRRAEQQAEKEEGFRHRLLDAIRQFPAGDTERVLRIAAGLNPSNFGTAVRALLKEGRIEACEIIKSGKKYDGYKPTGK